MSQAQLESLLTANRGQLLGFVRRRAARLLRYESAEDLVQGIHVRALERGHTFEYRGDAAFAGWIRTVARSHLADRIAYWTALRRRPAALLRLTAGAVSGSGNAAAVPAIDATGPNTFAERREQMASAVRALSFLLPRDREILHLASIGRTVREIADVLDLSHAAADKARERAMERFRKAFEMAQRAPDDD